MSLPGGERRRAGPTAPQGSSQRRSAGSSRGQRRSGCRGAAGRVDIALHRADARSRLVALVDISSRVLVAVNSCCTPGGGPCVWLAKRGPSALALQTTRDSKLNRQKNTTPL